MHRMMIIIIIILVVVGVCDLQVCRCFHIAGLHNVTLKGHNVETSDLLY